MTTDEEIAALRAATREAHEAIKDLRTAIREAADERQALTDLFPRLTEERIGEAVETGLAKFGVELQSAIDIATKKVFDRFDRISDIIMGETRANKRKREPTMVEQLEEARERGMFDKLVKHEFVPADADGNCKRCGMEKDNELAHHSLPLF